MSLFAAADAIGLVTFAVSGFLMGVRKGLDLLGIVIAAFLTALGGGVIRDVIVGRMPIAFTEGSVLLFVVAGIVLALSLKLHKKERPERFAIFIVMDSIGLVAFAITGALVGIEAKFNLFGVMLLAFMTAVGGGMLRDMMVNEVPIVLTSDFYGTIALLIALLVYLCSLVGCLGTFTLMSIAAGALFLRLLAYYKKWQLPKLGG
ncbi:trimeric intracellular cation channel family protein [Hydrogenimonas cancrithermarum]|uniref:Membrane protein n=1 Tax=Hydrogenimonas cancrithermarum TaxID=2993563 RepID=A0ABM8FMD5_9BACT|nr:TRIC cation channel family protein [Hydrogenimonas cancrithermarum]BDY12676.1 membrane protein [Hydrogenimonas cancrithermarum]